MKKKRVRVQVTCVCRAYDFPHRIGGGKCTGLRWVESYMEVDGMECSTCPYKLEGVEGDEQCEVLSEKDPIEVCAGYQEYLHKTVVIKLPKTLDEYMSEMYEDNDL